MCDSLNILFGKIARTRHGDRCSYCGSDAVPTENLCTTGRARLARTQKLRIKVYRSVLFLLLALHCRQISILAKTCRTHTPFYSE